MKKTLLYTLCIPTLASSASAISISLDFSTSSFFDTGTADGILARAAVQAAADDISAAVTSNLGPISQYIHSGVNGSTTVTMTGGLGYTNPDTGAAETFSGNLATNE